MFWLVRHNFGVQVFQHVSGHNHYETRWNLALARRTVNCRQDNRQHHTQCLLYGSSGRDIESEGAINTSDQSKEDLTGDTAHRICQLKRFQAGLHPVISLWPSSCYAFDVQRHLTLDVQNDVSCSLGCASHALRRNANGAPNSDGLQPTSFLFRVVWPGATFVALLLRS